MTTTLAQEYRPNVLLVSPSNNIGARKHIKYNVKNIEKISNDDNTQLWELNDNTDLESFMDNLKKDDNIDYVEKDYVLTLESLPNDKRLNNQWALKKNMLNMEKAWEIGTGSRDIIVPNNKQIAIRYENNDAIYACDKNIFLYHGIILD